MTPDADLVRRCLDGDRAAWADLVARYADFVHGLLWRTGLDPSARDDGFQEVWVLLWKHLPRLREAARLLPWIATTTRRVGWRLVRRSRARTDREASVARPEADAQASPDDALVRLEEEQAVREALGSLGEGCRRLLRALYFAPDSPSYDELAARLGIPRGSIGPTRQRCLAHLRAALADLGFGPPSPGVSADAPAASPSVKRSAGGRRGGPR